MLKTPKKPIWITHVNGQWGLLFSTNPDLVSDWRSEHRFTLHYYTGLHSQSKDTKLTVGRYTLFTYQKTLMLPVRKMSQKLPT